MNNKDLLNFIETIPKLEPIEFLGLSKILCVSTVNENMEPRKFEDIFSDMIDRFISIDRKQRRDILKVIKKASQYKEIN